jgi:hypothetical protein
MPVYRLYPPVSLVRFDLDYPVIHVCFFGYSKIIKLEDDNQNLTWSDPEPDAPSVGKNVSLAQDTSLKYGGRESPGDEAV